MRHNHSIHRHVETFAIAIVSILALVSSAQGEIVYHSADIIIGTYNLDLNGDGVTDFTIAVDGGLGCPPKYVSMSSRRHRPPGTGLSPDR
jgi:hypothetical protein